MVFMQELFVIITSNLLFTKILGTDILTFGKKNGRSINILALYVAVFSILCSLITAYTDSLVAEYLIPLVDIVIVLVLYFLGLGVTKAFGEKAFSSYKVYMHFAAFNTATMGILFNGYQDETMSDHIINSLECAGGFFIAAWMINIVYKFLSRKNIPKYFRGYPAVLIFIGLVSMAINSLV